MTNGMISNQRKIIHKFCLLVVLIIMVLILTKNHSIDLNTGKYKQIEETWVKRVQEYIEGELMRDTSSTADNSEELDHEKGDNYQNDTRKLKKWIMKDGVRSDMKNGINSSARGKPVKQKRRKLIFILAQGRSGSSLFGDLFNRDPEAFYIFEPFLAIERLNKFVHFAMDNKTQLEFYKNEATSFLQGLLTCTTNKQFEKYMNKYDEFGSRSRTAAFARKPFQSVWINSNLVLKLCKNLTVYTVIKELAFRLPDKKVEFLFDMSLKHNMDLKIIHLVRDPRAYLLSQMKLNWFYETTNLTSRKMENYVKNRCEETLNYINEIKLNEKKFKMKMEYLLFRYEDLLEHPDFILQKVSDMTGIDVVTKSGEWFRNMTTGKDLGEKNRYQNGVRNAKAVRSSWKSKIKKKLLDTIQKHCAEVMNELNYVSVEIKELSNRNVVGDFRSLQI